MRKYMRTKEYGKFNRRNILLSVAGAVVCLVFVAVLVRNGFMRELFGGCYRMSCIHIPQGTTRKLADVYEETKGSVYRALYTYPLETSEKSAFVRVDVRDHIDAETATDYIHGRIAGMKALYDNIRSPYPGLLSSEIVCDSEYKPTYSATETKQGIGIQVIVGYLNDRMTFGSCQKAEAKYKGMMILFACANKNQLYQIEFISSLEDFNLSALDAMVHGVECR